MELYYLVSLIALLKLKSNNNYIKYRLDRLLDGVNLAVRFKLSESLA